MLTFAFFMLSMLGFNPFTTTIAPNGQIIESHTSNHQWSMAIVKKH